MSDRIDSYFGRLVRRRRQMVGMTQLQLAESVGVRFQQIQKYESGINKLSAARLWMIARALDVPVTYFYDGLADVAPLAAQTCDRSSPLLTQRRAMIGSGATGLREAG